MRPVSERAGRLIAVESGPDSFSAFLPGDRALIIDQLVAKSLRCHTPITVVGNRWVRRDSDAYLATMAEWAGELEIEGHELEALIFGDKARRRTCPAGATRSCRRTWAGGAGGKAADC